MNISVLGCGWLGKALAQNLVQKGHTVKGSTTTPEKMDMLWEVGIHPYLLRFPISQTNASGFFQTSLLVIALPPGLRHQSAQEYMAQMENVLACKSKFTRVLFLSSTSVYPETTERVDESYGIEKETTGNVVLWEIEKYLTENLKRRLTIARLAGLAGYDRLIARHFSGKTGLEEGSYPANLVHRDDAVQILVGIIEKATWGEIYNVCAPKHPTKRELYTSDCQRFGLPIPEYLPSDSTSKIISAAKITEELNYRFKYPDPMRFSYEV